MTLFQGTEFTAGTATPQHAMDRLEEILVENASSEDLARNPSTDWHGSRNEISAVAKLEEKVTGSKSSESTAAKTEETLWERSRRELHEMDAESRRKKFACLRESLRLPYLSLLSISSFACDER